MAVAEYNGGGRKGFVIIPEGRGGRSWLGFALELWRFLNNFQKFHSGGKGPVPIRCELAVVVDTRPFAKVVVGQRQCGGSSTGLGASSPEAQTTNGQEVYGMRNEEAPQHVVERTSATEDVRCSGNEVRTILQSLKPQLENLRGGADRLIREVVLVLEQGGSSPPDNSSQARNMLEA